MFAEERQQAMVAALAAPATAAPAYPAPLVGADAKTAIADHYVVVLRDAAADRAVSAPPRRASQSSSGTGMPATVTPRR